MAHVDKAKKALASMRAAEDQQESSQKVRYAARSKLRASLRKLNDATKAPKVKPSAAKPSAARKLKASLRKLRETQKVPKVKTAVPLASGQKRHPSVSR